MKRISSRHTASLRSGNGAIFIILLASCAFLLWAFIWPYVSFPGEDEEERSARLAQIPNLMSYFPLARTNGQGFLIGKTPSNDVARILVMKALPKSSRDASGNIHTDKLPLHVIIPNRSGDFQALLASGSYSLLFEHADGALRCAIDSGWISVCAINIAPGEKTILNVE